MADFGFFDGNSRQQAISNVAMTYAGSVNTKGAWVQVSAAAPFDVSEIICMPFGVDVSGDLHVSWLYDFGVGPAGSETVLLADIWNQQFDFQSSRSAYQNITLPCTIPAGTRIAVRSSCSSAYGASVNPILSGAPFSGAPLTGTDTMGAVPAASGGTLVTAPSSGNGSWVQLVASTSKAYRRLGIITNCVTNGGNASDFYFSIELAVGAPGAETAILTGLFYMFRPESGGTYPKGVIWLPITLPAGVRISARCNFAGGIANSPRVVLYGAY